MRVMALFSTSFFAKYLRVGEDGPGRGHLCHTDTFLFYFFFFFFKREKKKKKNNQKTYYIESFICIHKHSRAI